MRTEPPPTARALVVISIHATARHHSPCGRPAVEAHTCRLLCMVAHMLEAGLAPSICFNLLEAASAAPSDPAAPASASAQPAPPSSPRHTSGVGNRNAFSCGTSRS